MPFVRSIVFALFAVSLTALAQPGGAPDKVFAIDKKTGKVASVEGVLKESAGGVVVTVGGKEKARFTSAEVVKVELGDLTGLTPDDRALLFGLDGERDFEKAARGYATLVNKTGDNPRVKRAIEFREVTALAKAADTKDETGFKNAAPAIADRLAAFAAANAKGWEVWPTSRAAARLFADLGQFERAAAVLATLAATPDLGPDLKIEAKLAEAECLLRSANPTAGRNAVASLLKEKDVPAAGVLRERLSIYDAWAKAPAPTAGTRPDETAAKLQASIDAATTPAARASGYFAKGELYLAAGLPRDAMWEYLNVEVVYNQDKDEVSKALRRLVQVFDAVGDKDRAEQYREKVRKVR